MFVFRVLNLVISGIPSIPKNRKIQTSYLSFKPCYKWNTFNTLLEHKEDVMNALVLNLVISGIPSIQNLEELQN